MILMWREEDFYPRKKANGGTRLIHPFPGSWFQLKESKLYSDMCRSLRTLALWADPGWILHGQAHGAAWGLLKGRLGT